MREILITSVVLAVAACGGGNAPPPAEPGPVASDPSGASGDNPDLVTGDQMDEVQRMFDRKRNAVSRCLSAAVDAKQLPKNSRGKIALDVTISPAGRAENVGVIHATLDSALLAECVIARVKEIAFPALPKSFQTSYTYAFEAM